MGIHYRPYRDSKFWNGGEGFTAASRRPGSDREHGAMVPVRRRGLGDRREGREHAVQRWPLSEPRRLAGLQGAEEPCTDLVDLGDAQHRTGERRRKHPAQRPRTSRQNEGRVFRVRIAAVPLPRRLRAHDRRQTDGLGCALRSQPDHGGNRPLWCHGYLLRGFRDGERPLLGLNRGPLADGGHISLRLQGPVGLQHLAQQYLDHQLLHV
mmetsp:Transcript_44730/g.129270  ORF Transcript_44730/g.129270 Transcript_44730/m.129270 type:complete len:209 (-) Transcript_44730:365-991(-)